MTVPTLLAAEPWIHGVGDVDGLHASLRTYGFAVLRGLLSEERLGALDDECRALQDKLVAGQLSSEHGTVTLVDTDGVTGRDIRPNYVTRATECSELIRSAVLDPALVEVAQGWIGGGWLLEGEPFGVVFQDTRAGRESGYTRIGWHSDWQSSPHLVSRWPSVAFTIHLDATSPDNGFLRVVPGSHRWATPAPFANVNGVSVPDGAAPAGGYTTDAPPLAMPLRFEKVPGEVALYCDRGDVLFHDGYLWHSAARATDDEGIRRHLRGSWYSGEPETGVTEQDFVKNAAR